MSAAAVSAWVTSFASRLRFPTLFALTAVLFALDLVIPDFLPFVDEILLGLVTLLLGSVWKKREAVKSRRTGDDGAVIDVEVEPDDRRD